VRRILQTLLNWAVLGAAIVGVGFFLRQRAHQQATPPAEPQEAPAQLASDMPNTLELAPHTVEAMQVAVVQVRPAPRTAPLRLFGSLYLEGSRLVHVQTRFTGQAVEVGETDDNGEQRALRPGDKVEKGQVLAKLWSKEVGEKKSDLVDAISKFHLHNNVLKRLQSLAGGAVASARVQEAERDVAADKIEIERLRRTLRSWQIQESELDKIQAEAERIIEDSLVRKNPASAMPASAESTPPTAHPPIIQPSEHMALDRTWAELDIVAPMTGVILEKNFTVGDIVDTSHDMFKIADLSRLGVMANVYEEDLPKLVALPADERRWQVDLLAEAGLPSRTGRFETIGNVIDPMQHTAIVKGWLDNPEGELRVGQFVSVTVQLPNRPGLVVVPTSSLIDEGSRTFVFVATGSDRTHYTRREVKVARRGAVMGMLESHPQPHTAAQNGASPEPIEPGELVVTSGTIELAGAYHTLATQQPIAAATPEEPSALEVHP
jgi:cobalt-zinc-cadmium efflux system membrane fusion protein